MRRAAPQVTSTILLAGLAASLPACRGCSPRETERPIRFVGKNAEAVLEIRDLGVLARSRDKLIAVLGSAVTKEQVTALEQELTLTLGFNPLAAQGLEEAGLPKEGSIAVEIASAGGGAVWIVPVQDAPRFEKTLDHVIRARTSIESSEKTKVAGKDVTVMGTSFGPEKITVAAYTFDRGLALIGAGPKARELIEKALALGAARGKEDASILANPEYTALDRALGTAYDARIIVPSIPDVASGLIQRLTRLGGSGVAGALAWAPESKAAKSIGWQVDLHDRTAEVKGRVRLTEEGLAKTKKVFGRGDGPPAGVGAIAFDEAVLFAYVSGDPRALLEEGAPPGSPARAELDRAILRVKEDIDTDLEKEVVPILTGHGAIAMGLGNLGSTDIREILQNPASVLWTVIAIGTSNAEKFQAIEGRLDHGLEARGFAIDKRSIDAAEVHVVGRRPEGSTDLQVLVESVTADGARVYSNERAITDRVLKDRKTAKTAPLGGKPGALVEIRFRELAKQLGTLNLGALPVLYRAVAAKVLDTLRLVDRASLEIGPTDDGIAFGGKLQLTPAEEARKAP